MNRGEELLLGKLMWIKKDIIQDCFLSDLSDGQFLQAHVKLFVRPTFGINNQSDFRNPQ